MNGKQNAIFFIGLTLIIMVFFIHGYWHILKEGIFTNTASVKRGGLSNSGTANPNNPVFGPKGPKPL